MPMVFSATVSSIPALEASHAVSSSIAPRPRPASPGPLLAIYLELPREELQATSARARVNRSAGVAPMQGQVSILHFCREVLLKIGWSAAANRTESAPNGMRFHPSFLRRRFQSARNMQYKCRLDKCGLGLRLKVQKRRK